MCLIDTATGWLHGAVHRLSPNADERPCGVSPDLVVIHAISLPPGEFGGNAIDALFTNTLHGGDHPCFVQLCGLHVSAHVLIRRDGSLVQFVSFLRRAWHAGASAYKGRNNCNDFSIGIELEGCDDLPFESRQYEVLSRLVKELMRCYPTITGDRIVGHCDIAPGRKTDPGPLFDWPHFFTLLGRVSG